MLKRIAVVLVLLLGATSCSGGADGDEWASFRGEMVVQGISDESTRCVIDELEQAGVAPEDLTTEVDAATLAAGQAAYDAAAESCFTDTEVDALIAREIEAILPDIANGLGISIAETRCIVAGFESQGLSFAEVARGNAGPEVGEAMATLLPQCTEEDEPAPPATTAPDTQPDAAQPDSAQPDTAETDAAEPEAAETDSVDPAASGESLYDTPAFRQLIIEGIASGTGESTEVAECILEGTLAQGITIDDFVTRGGDDFITAAVTEASVSCLPG